MMQRKGVHELDTLQPYLARDAVTCLVELLTGQQPGAQLSAEPLGAVMMLIKQAQVEAV
jgi:hypothetical protein